MEPLLQDRACVVTGGASGNGRAIARRCAAHGADVIVADIREEPREGGEPTHELIARETDRSARHVECDVTERADLEAAVAAADAFGGIDVMVNNAAITRPEDFLETTPEEYEHLMRVNATSVFFGSQAAIRRLVDDDRGGSVVNVSSAAGLVGSRSSASYSASKGAIRLLTYSLAAQYGVYGVRVNAVHPGTIETHMTVEDLGSVRDGTADTSGTPLDRIGRPEEVADAVVFLASDLASYVTAESLVVDGGRTNTM